MPTPSALRRMLPLLNVHRWLQRTGVFYRDLHLYLHDFCLPIFLKLTLEMVENNSNFTFLFSLQLRIRKCHVCKKTFWPGVIWTFWCIANVPAAALSLPRPHRQEGFTMPTCWAHRWKLQKSKKLQRKERKKRDVHLHLCPPRRLSQAMQTIGAAVIGVKTIIPGPFSRLPFLSPLSYIWV